MNQTNNRIREEWVRKLRDNFAPHEIPPIWDENDEVTYPLLENFIDELLKSQREVYKDALIWCSGSEDFQIEGKAREGWEKICLPLIKE